MYIPIFLLIFGYNLPPGKNLHILDINGKHYE